MMLNHTLLLPVQLRLAKSHLEPDQQAFATEVQAKEHLGPNHASPGA